MVFNKTWIFVIVFLSIIACSSSNRQISDRSLSRKLIQDPLTPQETKEVISTSATNWFYGRGLGDSAVKVVSSVAFPPFALFWLGDVGLEASGYSGFSFYHVLPESTARPIVESYQGLVEIPGHLTAKVAGQEFRDRQRSEEKIRKILTRHENPVDLSDV